VKPPLPRLHAVTNALVLEFPDFVEHAAALAKQPDICLHVRSDSHGGRRLSEIAAGLTRVCGGRSRVFLNDRVDVALAVEADGIHLPSAGLQIRSVRDLVGPNVLIGRSTHSAAEALAAHEEGADYIFLGPIWPTSSHPGIPGLGTGAIAEARSVPVIAIGGVTPERASAAIDAGAYGVAAITALWDVADSGAAAERMLLSLHI
jgi:thiamine-phosphate diphosphorylase